VAAGPLSLRGDVVLDGSVGELSMESMKASEVHLAVQVTQGSVAMPASEPIVRIGRLSLDAGAREVDVLNPLESFHLTASLPEASIVDRGAVREALGDRRLIGGELRLRAAANLDVTAGVAVLGNATAQVTHGGLAVGPTRVLGDLDLSIHAGAPRERTVAGGADLAGSRLAMRHVVVTGASTDSADWSGDLTVEAGTLRLAGTPGLDADLALHARDANPILGLVFRDALPELVVPWTRMKSFTAVTHVFAEPNALVVSGLVASGGAVSVEGSYARRAGSGSGAFVVREGPWSAGIDVDATGPHLRLFGLDGWYRGRVKEIVAAPQRPTARLDAPTSVQSHGDRPVGPSPPTKTPMTADDDVNRRASTGR
jgi:hypothetical protein